MPRRRKMRACIVGRCRKRGQAGDHKHGQGRVRGGDTEPPAPEEQQTKSHVRREMRTVRHILRTSMRSPQHTQHIDVARACHDAGQGEMHDILERRPRRT